MTQIPPFPTIREFVFNTPLYTPVDLSANWTEAIELFRGRFQADGYCLECELQSTFRRTDTPGYGATVDILVDAVADWGFRNLEMGCTRDWDHRLQLYVYILGHSIQKIGQHPSLADIANDESKTYRKVLSRLDSQELHKAVGLASHGVGIGSYVYLRRIFERLIRKRFDDYKSPEGWNDVEFLNLRMNERVDFLKDHLPPFLVENSRVYSILSLGIHELTEDEAKAFFPVLKASIIMILDEDEETRRKLELKKQLAGALASFAPKGDKTV